MLVCYRFVNGNLVKMGEVEKSGFRVEIVGKSVMVDVRNRGEKCH